jgi:hypothetical protein
MYELLLKKKKKKRVSGRSKGSSRTNKILVEVVEEGR